LPIRVAVVGFGSSGKRFLCLAKEANPSARFLVVTGQEVLEQGVQVSKSLDVLSGFDPHIVVLTGPASTRSTVAMKIPSTTKGVFLEKPIGVSFAAGEHLVSLLNKPSTLTQIGYNLRFSESLIIFRSMVQKREYGAVLSGRAETGQYLPSWRPGRDYRGTVSANSLLGGGVLLELSHEWDYLGWIFGEVKWVRSWFGRASGLDIDVEDCAHVTMGYDRQGSENELIVRVDLDFIRHDSVRTVTAICERATLRWDGVAGLVEVFTEESQQWQTVFQDSGTETTYEAQWKSFLNALETGCEPEVTLEDGLEVLRIVEAVRQSHESGGVQIVVDRTEFLL
jgi:predicted dehydrogenase